ncbi:hypothetical protein ZWY2020_033065 [Hordeum vulgare]|nr:hypothetical protein ZWY2020_033065 [Hordeum vulgare]
MFVRYGHKPYGPETPHPHPHGPPQGSLHHWILRSQKPAGAGTILYVLANSPALESMEVDPTVVLLDPTDQALYLPEDNVFQDGYKIATMFLCEADHRHVVEVVSICPCTNILMSLRKRILLSHRLLRSG